jgi:hypothetical protein
MMLYGLLTTTAKFFYRCSCHIRRLHKQIRLKKDIILRTKKLKHNKAKLGNLVTHSTVSVCLAI